MLIHRNTLDVLCYVPLNVGTNEKIWGSRLESKPKTLRFDPADWSL
jgi:hypothetical protein